MKKTDKYILIIVGVILFLSIVGIYGYRMFFSTAGTTAVITQNGKVINTIELDKVEKPYEFTINSQQGGYNTIYVDHGSIRVIDADCPDRLCIHTGTLSKTNDIAVCLPHGLFIEIKNGVESEIDSLAH